MSRTLPNCWTQGDSTSSEAGAAISEIKRQSSSESLSAAPTEDSGIDDDDDDGIASPNLSARLQAELKGAVRDPPYFLCVTNSTLRGKGDSLCYHPAVIGKHGRSLPEVPSRAGFTALMRPVKSLEASLQRQNVLRRHSEPRKRSAGRRNSDEVQEDEKNPGRPHYEDEESYDEETDEDEWLP
ncbi:hypothetical protein QBC45DRAFT_432625 [Copromyces sp. CBS 386.78]|nr:hypothetical protein QBC45DRAFT_432625 [Copromyces sp. CBS 386.78]